MEWISMLGMAASVTSCLCQLVGIEICFRIVRKGNTSDVSPVPFIAFFVNSCVWLKYGLMTNNTSVMLPSCEAIVLQSLYICIYYAYTAHKRILTGMILIGLISLFVPFIYVTYFEKEANRAVRNVGLYCCFVNVIVFASPLATLVPNALGVVLGFIQFSLFCFYGCQHKSSKPIVT
ncbi:hypothetical protein BsWGS_01233 [Bradybaena similaris]